MIRFLQTPGPIKKIVLGGIILIFCGAMVITLIPGGVGSDLTGQPGKGIVAKVEGGDVTADQVRLTARQMLQQQMQGRDSANMGMLLPFFAQRAAEQLITRQALMAQAAHLGLRVTPQEIQDELQHGRYAATFFPGGNFIGQTEYNDMLQRAGLTPTVFEESVGKDILLTKLQALIAGSATVSDAEIRQQFVKQNTKVKFDYAVLKQDDLKKGLHPAEAELKAYYESHKQQYANSIPEKRKVKYAVIATSKLENGVQVTQADLQAAYDKQRDQFRVPGQIKVSQILIKTPLPGTDGKVDQKGIDEARHRAEDLKKQLDGGAKFEDVAKKYSEDPSSKQGGSVGWIQHFPVPDVDKTAYALPKGGVSGVISAGYAFVIIRVDDKQEAHMKTLDEVKADIEPLLKQQKVQQLAQKQAEALVNQARGQGLDAAAAAQKIPVITSEFFTRKDLLPGLGPANQFMDAVFGATEKSPPEMAPTSQGFAVYQLLSVKPPSTPSFEEVRTKLEDEFKNERSSILLSQKTQELSDRAKAEHDLKRAAKELGATVKTSDFVAPDGQVPDLGSMSGQASVAFSMKPGEISGPVQSGSNGVVLSLLENQAPTDADYAAKRDQIREQLRQTKQQELFGLFVSNLRDQMEKSGKIKINQQELKALTRTGGEEGM